MKPIMGVRKRQKNKLMYKWKDTKNRHLTP